MSMRRASLCIAAVAVALPAGCLGSSSSSSHNALGDGKVWGSTANLPSGVDIGTEKTLLAEWRAARFSCTGEQAGCPYQPGPFATGKVLLSSMRRINHSIPATDSLNATLAITRFVFVLSDSDSNRLDIAMADANGRYVHLIAVGTAQPRLRIAAL
jgi:hypothetical protein